MKINAVLILLFAISILVGCKKTSEESSPNTLTTSEFVPNVGALKIACIGNSITEGDGIKDKKMIVILLNYKKY
ncbi:MAG: hypothetical protein HC803_09490 [Saprospiraceae bacterium]|nr:hypothetical protein [Saprospiraceae bacterium]